MTFAEFLQWEVDQSDCHEFIDSRPVPVPPSSQARSLLISDIVALLRPAVRETGLRVFTNFRIRCGQDILYPSVIIDAGPFDPDAIFPTAPIAVIDVDRDRNWSLLPNVRYLSLVAGDEPERVLTLIER